ncbi:MAG: RNase adapter RapZ [Ilumatobacteraceae bacterium]
MTEFLVITGLSGAGRSLAADGLEDLGWFVVDNLPIELLDKVVELSSGPGSYSKLSLVVGPTTHPEAVCDAINRLREHHRVRVLFLDASTPELVKRYGTTRRKHPLDDGASGMADTIERERALLEIVKAEADLIVDTTELNVHQLRAFITETFGTDSVDETLQIAVMSFGYKHGLPLDVDLVIDVRFLPNPHWIEDLRPLTGLDAPVRNYVMAHELTREFLERFEHLLDLLLPGYLAEGKSYLSLAIGCTGGRHRSVALAEEIAGWFRAKGHRPRVTHRDIEH